MGLMRRIVKPGGLLYLSVPLGRDKVIFNIHRIYGRIRLPLLLRYWKELDSFGFEEFFSIGIPAMAGIRAALYGQPVGSRKS